MRFVVMAGVCAALLWWCSDRNSPPVKVGSFNIEHFPHSPGQVRGAFAALAALDLDVIGLQEITDPSVAQRAAREHLGNSWRSVFCETCPVHRLGVLYDGDKVQLLNTLEHPQLVLYRGARPAFEVQFDGLRVIVVHLKAGADGGRMRERQIRALRPIVADATRSGDRVVVVGDFNATGDSDRASIAELAAATRMVWASRDLDCTCYWQRRESCFAAALDHVLTSVEPTAVQVGGACAEIGCQPGRSCPTYKNEVSDHCPVRVDVP